MNKYFWKYTFLCGMFLILCNVSSFGQSDLKQAKQAILQSEFLVLNGALKNSAFDSLYYNQAENLVKLHEYTLAIEKLNRINLSSIHKDFRNKVISKLSIVQYLNSDFNGALRNAKSLYYSNMGDSIIMRDAILLQSICLNNLQKWDETRQIIANSNFFLTLPSKREVFDSLYNKVPKLKNPETARLLSHIIPGSGQIYSGAIGEGLFNFTLQASILALSGYGIYQQYYLTSYFSGLGLFQKFYFGGGERASYLAEQRNERKAKAFNQKANNLILKQ